MKVTLKAFCLLAVIGIFSCKKSSDNEISLTASTTAAKVGETVSVTLTSSANASSWTVSPSSTATQTYGITTSKVNYFTFTQPGVYTVAVRARSVDYDSTKHQSLDSCWNHGGGTRGQCTKGKDTASVSIIVNYK